MIEILKVEHVASVALMVVGAVIGCLAIGSVIGVVIIRKIADRDRRGR